MQIAFDFISAHFNPANFDDSVVLEPYLILWTLLSDELAGFARERRGWSYTVDLAES